MQAPSPLHVDLNQCEATPNPYKLGPIKLTEEQNILCRGIVFGNIYGGIIYPPNQAQYYPTAIVAVVVFGPVFAQSWFIGPNRVIVWSTTIFYKAGGVRIYNPSKPPRSESALHLLSCGSQQRS